MIYKFFALFIVTVETAIVPDVIHGLSQLRQLLLNYFRQRDTSVKIPGTKTQIGISAK